MKTAYTIRNSSFDLRQEVNAKVIGVLKYNNKIREELLKRNIGVYSPSNLNEGIGYISNLYSLESRKPLSLGEDGLLGHTHIYQSDYQKYINLKYGIGDSISYYQHGSLPDSNNLKWGGKYNNYLDYASTTLETPYLEGVSDVFSAIQSYVTNTDDTDKWNYIGDTFLTIRSVLNDFLQYDNIKYAMEKTRIGTVTPNPVAAYMGNITTNINNFNGKDTALGTITNYLYAQSLYAGAHFNSLRKPKYITPGAYALLGNNLSTIATIGTDFRIDDETGRIIADFNKIFDEYELEKLTLNDFVEKYSYNEKDRLLANSNHSRYRNLVAVYGEKPHYSPFDGGKWYEWEFVKGNTDDFNHTMVGDSKNSIYKLFYLWNEGDKNKEIYEGVKSSHGFGSFSAFNSLEKENDLLTKTQTLFEKHDNKGIDTLIGRFHTSGDRDNTHNKVSLLQSAISNFGISHGRNLLTKKAYETGVADKINSYENPYCRTWTYHHQYDNISNLIRPFGIENYDENGESVSVISSIGELQKNWHTFGRPTDAAQRLNDNTVLNRNGFVNITPINQGGNEKYEVDIKKCMFSIENLAWKDIEKTEEILSRDQQGPNGGRIMWFPPYDLKFNENVNVNWSNNEFIGRGEKIYTYTNTERSGTLSFLLLVDHPSILDAWKKDINTISMSGEQELLRFFAGCEVLTINGKKNDEISINNDEQTSGIPTSTKSTQHILRFYIFFPNNYSGYNDDIDAAITELTNNYEANQEERKEYRMDEDYDDQNLKDGNRKDLQNFNLNIWTSIPKVMKEKGYGDADMSFKTFIDKGGDILKNATIEEITCIGNASNHGYEKSNEELTKRRTNFGKNIIEEIFSRNDILYSYPQKIDEEYGNVIKVSTEDIENVSGISAKLARHTKVIIKYNTTANITTTNTITINNEDNGTDAQTFNLRREKQNKIRNISDKVNLVYLNARKKHLTNKKTKTEEKLNTIEEKINNLENKNHNYTPTNIDFPIPVKRDPINLKTDREIHGITYEVDTDLKTKKSPWENESEYFEMLKDKDSFLYSRIVDKIKYFSPAFHSITPEGFNARLSFLHQCTRQGPTYSVSDTDNKYKSAGNLAFGRPPICILRIGDFYYTKIVIDSITIDYENPQWDMNPEGIGMQPMFARISLNFKFLGGSDIEAPIARLQNAVSFNYYANQSIYDERADKMITDDNKVQKIKYGTTIKNKKK